MEAAHRESPLNGSSKMAPPGRSCGQGDTSGRNLSRRPDFLSLPCGEIEEDWQCPPVSRFTPFEKSLTHGTPSTTKIDRSTARFSWYQPPSLAGGPSHPVQMVGGQAQTALSGLGRGGSQPSPWFIGATWTGVGRLPRSFPCTKRSGNSLAPPDLPHFRIDLRPPCITIPRGDDRGAISRQVTTPAFCL